MTLQKLSAGSGYEYLTRQVAALDSTEKGSVPLADLLLGEGRVAGTVGRHRRPGSWAWSPETS